MKSFTLFFGFALVVAASAAWSEEQKARALEHIRVCRGESGFTEDALRKMKSGDVSDNSVEAKTFAKCFLKHIGFLDEAGNFIPSVAVEKLTTFLGDKTKAEDTVKDCQAIDDKTDQDAVPLAIYKCYIQHKLLTKQE